MHPVGDGGLGKGLSRRIYALLGATAALLAICLGAAAGASASGFAQGPPAGPTSPPFFQCPQIGRDATCGYLIDVTNPATQPTILQDATQGPYDEGGDDVTVAVQNDTNQPLGSVHVGVAHSGDNVFGFDGDGLCSEEQVNPKPEGCPFGPPGNFADPFDYFGPDTVLTPEPNSGEFGSSGDAGTVAFNTPLQPGQFTYFSLEAPLTGTYVVAGEVNDIVSTTLKNTKTSETGTTITAPEPVGVTDTATILGPNKEFAGGEVTYNVYSDPACKTLVKGSESTRKVVGGTAEPSASVGEKLENNHTYYWVVEFTGNAGEHPNTKNISPCGNETMTFGTPPPPPTPTVVTVLSGGGQVGTHITVPAGTPVTDTAAVIAPGGQPITGRLSYTAYTTPNCAIGSQVAGVTGGGLTTGSGPSSNAVALPIGTYYYQAFYSGNGALNHAVSPCGSEVLTVVTPPPPPPPPNSQFTSVGTPQVNEKTGQIVVIGQFPAPGTATASGVVTQGATLARVRTALAALAEDARRKKSKRCKHGFVRKHKKCVNNEPVVYGTTINTIPSPGTYSLVINPSRRALKALKTGKRLAVVVSTTFQNRAGGLPVTHVQDVSVKLKLKKKHRHGKRGH
jgi:hypothetical protein